MMTLRNYCTTAFSDDLNTLRPIVFQMKKVLLLSSTMVFLTLLLMTGSGIINSAHACPITDGDGGLKGNPTTPNSPTTQISQTPQPLQSQSV